MWFMIKGAFWFSLVLMALPIINPGTQTDTEKPTASAIDIPNSLSAAMVAIDDLRQICERKPDVCDKGAQTLNALGLQARDGAEIAFKMLDEKFASSISPDAKPVTTVSNSEQPLLTGSLPTTTRIPIPTFIR